MAVNEKNLLENVTVIIRSVGERTTSICQKLIIEQGLPADAVFVVNEAPFSKAMRESFSIGIKEGRPWTFCVDADVLLRPQSILNMLKIAVQQKTNVCEIQGYVLDKFFGGTRQAGNHLYRTSLLNKMIEAIPDEGVNIRPETYALNVMKNIGHPWIKVNTLIGLHDFEQSHEDIFRKSFIQAHKHLEHFRLIVPYWRECAKKDDDYLSALSGLAAGVEHIDSVRIDINAEYYLTSMSSRIGNQLKDPIQSGEWDLNRVENIINQWREPILYSKYYRSGMVKKESLKTKVLKKIKKTMVLRSLIMRTC
jgi:hypothetical protein